MPTPTPKYDENGFPEFEPVRFYDAPATLLTQIWDGETSLGRAVRTLLRSESLSPTERDSYAQRLKKAYGGNALMDTTIDVATNPFTWLLLATMPIGAKQFIASKGKLFHGLAAARAKGQKMFVGAAEIARALQVSNLLTMGQTVAPTMVAQTIGSRWDVLSRLESEVLAPSGLTMAQARDRLQRKLGVDDLDPSRHQAGAKADQLREMDILSHLWSTGALDGGKAKYARTRYAAGGMFKPVFGGVVSDTAIPLMMTEDEYRNVLSSTIGGGIRPGDQVRIGSGNFIVGDQGVIRITNNKKFKKVLNLFPKSERADINYRTMLEEEQNLFSVGGIDRNFFNEWARRNNIQDELVDYLEAGRNLREEMKKRTFYKVDAAGTPLPTNELDVDKIMSLWSKWQRQRDKTGDLSAHEMVLDSLLPMSEVDRILPAWAKQAARRGSLNGVTTERIRKLIQDKVEPLLQHTYLPRNNYRIYKMQTGPGGGIQPLGPAHSDALVRRRESIVDSRGIAGFVLPRRGEGIPWDPQDLETIAKMARERGMDPAAMDVTFPHLGKPITLDKAVQQMDGMVRSSLLSGENQLAQNRGHLATHSLGYEMNMRSYMRDATSTIILHGSQVPPSMYGLLREAIRNRAPQLRGAYSGPVRPGTAMTPEDLNLMQMTNEATGELIWSLPETITSSPEALRARGRLSAAYGRRNILLSRPDSSSRTAQLTKINSEIRGYQATLNRLGKMQSPPAQSLLTGATPFMTIDDAIETMMRVESPEVQEYFQRVVLPGLFGGSNPASHLQLRLGQQARDMARSVASSSAGQWIKKNGGSMGQAIINNMEQYGQLTGYNLDSVYAQGGITGYLYATHLGFNAVSAMWNMLQPLQWATTWMGGEHILKGYASAFKQLGGYYAERVSKHGLGRMAPEEQMKLWQKHIRLAGSASGGRDLLGMGHDAISMMEGSSFMRRPQGTPSLGKWLLIDMPMALFQAAEAVNRITVAEATMGWLGQLQRQSGIRLAGNEALDFAQLMQSTTNFNYNPITQLQAFQKGGLLGNSLLRMFLQYPTRTLSNLFISNQLGGGTRSFGFGRFGGPTVEIPAVIGDMSRLLGTGAVAYEIGKNMFNVDLSSGLAGSALGQLPSQFMSKGLPVPPVIDIPAQLISSLGEGDREQFRQAAFRLLPGGIAIQKVLGAMPALPGGGNFGIIQSQYADWGNRNEQGMVPVYDSNGMLQSFDSPFSLVMRGIGADFKKHQSPQEATKFLLANRQEMVNLRRKFKDAVLGNNMTAANAIEAEYRKRYGVPMTVKEGEWDRAISMRETSVSERMLDTMPSDVRGMYQQALAGSPFAQRMGLPPGSLAEGETAKQRESVRRFNVDIGALAGQNPE